MTTMWLIVDSESVPAPLAGEPDSGTRASATRVTTDRNRGARRAMSDLPSPKVSSTPRTNGGYARSRDARQTGTWTNVGREVKVWMARGGLSFRTPAVYQRGPKSIFPNPT